jgi:hypothetical protein
MIPLQRGANEVNLVFTGTSAMWWALVISTLGWFGVGGALLRQSYRRRGKAVAVAVRGEAGPADGLRPAA